MSAPVTNEPTPFELRVLSLFQQGYDTSLIAGLLKDTEYAIERVLHRALDRCHDAKAVP